MFNLASFDALFSSRTVTKHPTSPEPDFQLMNSLQQTAGTFAYLFRIAGAALSII